MARSFREFLDNTSDADLGRTMRDRYVRLLDAHARGITDTHPSAQWNADNQTLRQHFQATRDARDTGADPGDQPGGEFDPSNVASSKEIERADQPGAQDDPPPSSRAPGTPALPQRNGGPLQRGAATDSARVANDAALKAAIPGLDRLGVPAYKGPKVDESGIVQVPRSW